MSTLAFDTKASSNLLRKEPTGWLDIHNINRTTVTAAQIARKQAVRFDLRRQSQRRQ